MEFWIAGPLLLKEKWIFSKSWFSFQKKRQYCFNQNSAWLNASNVSIFEKSGYLARARARARARRRSAGGPHVSVGGRRPPLSVYRECCALARAAAVCFSSAARSRIFRTANFVFSTILNSLQQNASFRADLKQNSLRQTGSSSDFALANVASSHFKMMLLL